MARINKSIKSAVRRLLKFTHPNYYLSLRAKRAGSFEREIIILKELCDENKKSLDIGASYGTYSFYLLNYSESVVAFEAVKRKFLELCYLFRRKNQIQIENVALSDSSGKAIIRIPSLDTGRSTLEKSNDLSGAKGDIQTEQISCKKLDDLEFKNVGLIKIDVEGHESAVLRGSLDTIKREKPNMIIEIEERHKSNSIKSVTEFLKKLDYEAYFFDGNELFNISKFNYALHHDFRKENYIYNFIFIHSTKVTNIKNTSIKFA